MKRTITIILALCAICITGFSQNKKYKPLTSWPFVYEDFQPGRITTYQGAAIDYDQLNISLINGKPLFIKDGKIMEPDSKTIALLVIGEDSYISANGVLLKVLKNTLKSAVVQMEIVDAEAMNKANIGYGKSSLASTQNVSASALSFEFEVVNAGVIDGFNNKGLDTMKQDKESGETLVTKRSIGIYYKGMFVPATRYDVLNIFGIDKDAVKDFIKAEKIKFNKVDDLAKLVDFLYGE